eukprot:c21983_g1_i1 orf=219-2060(+)
MASLPKEELAKYAHSPVHYAVACKDHAGLRKIIDALPQLANPGLICTEEDALVEEQRAEALSKEIDRRDVAGRETPLHLAVRMRDAIAAEMMIASGADTGLQNEQGWSALQEAICAHEEAIAALMMRHYAPQAWAKWCRRVPRVIGTMKKVMDFYMEVTFHFESSVIPFIGKIAPSDTYRIWKRDSNLRADMTISGFDGFKIKRSDQSIMFLGEGSTDGNVPPRSLCVLKHKERHVVDVLDGVGRQLTESEAVHEVTAMSETNMYRPGLDVTRAALVPQLTWRRQERSEMVGKWKCKVYDMHRVQLSLRSRRVPGALTDEEFMATAKLNVESMEESKDFAGLFNEEEKKQLDKALGAESAEVDDDSFYDASVDFDQVGLRGQSTDDAMRASSASCVDFESRNDKNGNFGLGKRSSKHEGADNSVRTRRSLCNDGKVSSLLEDSNGIKKDKRSRVVPANNGAKENEYSMGLRPMLWLTPSFPLRIEEMLPLLDILASKVKAVRRLREVLTTKLPAGTFPVKIAIPIAPSIRVVVTFTKFERLGSNDTFVAAPPRGKESDNNGSPWFSWKRGSTSKVAGSFGVGKDQSNDAFDPFTIPDDYLWIGRRTETSTKDP